jgi:hypothetical protein
VRERLSTADISLLGNSISLLGKIRRGRLARDHPHVMRSDHDGAITIAPCNRLQVPGGGVNVTAV